MQDSDDAEDALSDLWKNAKQHRIQYFGNEIVPETTLIKMESKSQIGSPLFLIHAMDGTVSILNSLTRGFDHPVWGLQCTQEAPIGNFTLLAKYYIDKIKSVQSKGPYAFIGYSYGAIIALEMADLLENADETVKLYLIDGSPDYVTFYMKSILDRRGLVSSVDGVDDKFNKFRIAVAFFAGRINPSVTFVEVIEKNCALKQQKRRK